MRISIKKLPAGEKKKAPQGRFCIFTIAQNAAQDLLPLTPFATTSLVSKSQPVKCVFFVCGFATAKGCDGLCCCVAGFLPLEAGMFFAPEWGGCVGVFVHVCAAVWLVFCLCKPGCFLLPIFSRMGCVCVSLCMSVLLCGCLSASASRDVSSSKILVCGGSLCAYVYCLHVMLLTCCVWLLACYGANMSLLFTWSVAHMLSC